MTNSDSLPDQSVSSSLSTIALREATPLDSLELNRFFSSIPLQGLLDVRVRRQVDFFSFFYRLGYKFKTFLLEDNGRNILGTASFLFQNRSLAHQTLRLGLGCDLRISPQRKSILSWGEHFLPLIEKIKADHNLDALVSSINLSDSQVMNAFIRPKTKRAHRPVYELIQKYNLVTVHGFYPLHFKKNKNVQVEVFQKSDKAELIDYIQKNIHLYDLVNEDLISDLDQYIQKSLLYSWHQFIIAKDAHGKIIGCAHPLSSSLLQNYFPMNYNSQAHNFRQFLKMASFLRFARKLTRPYARSQKEETLLFKMMHFLFFDHPDVLKNLLHYSYKNTQQNEFLIYAYQPENFQLRPPLGSIHTQIPYALYEIRAPHVKNHQMLKSKIKKWIYLDHFWF